MILSILICSLEERQAQLATLLESIHSQIEVLQAKNEVEIISVIDNRQATTGAKRNMLLALADGKYSVFVDDDDELHGDYVTEILEAAKQDADCITFNGFMTTNGVNKMPFDIALNNPYKLEVINRIPTYLRFPNHITPIKHDIAIQVQFEDKTFGEDYSWANEIRNRGLLKTEAKINKELYHYKFITNKRK